MTSVSLPLNFGLVRRDTATGAPLGYISDAVPTLSNAAAISSSLLAVGCSTRLVTAHLDYVFSAPNWKTAYVYEDGTVSSLNTLALRKEAFKAAFKAWHAKWVGKKNGIPLNVEFFLDLGYTMTPLSAQYGDYAFVIGEIGYKRRGSAQFATLSPPSGGIPDICDGLVCVVAQGQYEGQIWSAEFQFKWLDGSVWRAWINPGSNYEYTDLQYATSFDQTYTGWLNPGDVTNGSGPSVAEVIRLASIYDQGVMDTPLAYPDFCLQTKQTKMTGVVTRTVKMLPVSKQVKDVWWTLTTPVKLPLASQYVATQRGYTVASASLGAALEGFATEAGDTQALVEATRMKNSSAVWRLHYVGPRAMRRKLADLKLAAEGDINQLADEQIIETGNSRYPSGLKLKEVPDLLTARSLKEGVTFQHMVSQADDSQVKLTAGTSTVVVDYVNSAYVYTYAPGLDASDIYAAMADAGDVAFSVSTAASTALAAGSVRVPADRWALDNFAKTYADLLAECAALSKTVGSLWNPRHYYDPIRPWITTDLDTAELAFLQEISGGFDARAMLVAVAESSSYTTFK